MAGGKCSINLVYALVVAMSSMTMGEVMCYPSPTGVYIRALHNLTDDSMEWAFYNAVVTITAITGTFVVSGLLKCFGNSRKLVVFTVDVMGVAFWLANGVTKMSIWAGMGSRALLGIVAGCSSAISPVYLVELAPTGAEGFFGFFHQLFVVIGFVVILCLAPSLDFLGLNYVGAATCAIQGILIWFIAESPAKARLDAEAARKAASKDRERELDVETERAPQSDGASDGTPPGSLLLEIPQDDSSDETSLNLAFEDMPKEVTSEELPLDVGFEDEPIDDSFDEAPTGETFDDDPPEGAIDEMEGSSSESSGTSVSEPAPERVKETLCQLKNLKSLGIGVAMMFFQQFGGQNAIGTNLTDLMNQSGLPLDGNYQAAIARLAQALSLLLGSLVADKMGSKVMWIISSVGVSACMFLYSLELYFHFNPIMPLMCTFGYLLMFGQGLGPLPWMAAPTLFPDSVRASGVMVVTASSWLFAFTTLMSWPMMVKTMGSFGVFLMFALVAFVSTLFGIFVLKPKKRIASSEESMEDMDDQEASGSVEDMDSLKESG